MISIGAGGSKSLNKCLNASVLEINNIAEQAPIPSFRQGVAFLR